MSFITGTQSETLYAFSGASTQLATFTTEDNLLKTYPPIIIPPGFFRGTGSMGKALRVTARGRLGTTGSPTFTWTVRLLTSTTWSAGGIVLGTTGAITAGATVTLAPWRLGLDVVLRTESIGGASTVSAMGSVEAGSALASPFAGTIPANNTAVTVATIDNSTQYYLFLSAACGTSNALNLIETQQIIVEGLN